MITVRHAEERGSSKLSWLDSRHSFSFADYYDASQMGFRALRVINDEGFGSMMHGVVPHPNGTNLDASWTNDEQAGIMPPLLRRA